MPQFIESMKFLNRASALALAMVAMAGRAAETPDLEEAARRVVEGTNALRRAEDCGALKTDAKLQATARGFAEWMAKHDEYGHEADGKLPRDRARTKGYEDCMVAENIAYQMSSKGFTTAELARRLVEGWKGSSGHRRNMVDPDAVDTAVAIARSADSDRYYAVQMFGRPRSMRTRFEVRNESHEPLAYRVGERSFTLGGRSTRAHEVCGSERLRFRVHGRTTDEVPGDGGAFTVR